MIHTNNVVVACILISFFSMYVYSCIYIVDISRLSTIHTHTHILNRCFHCTLSLIFAVYFIRSLSITRNICATDSRILFKRNCFSCCCEEQTQIHTYFIFVLIVVSCRVSLWLYSNKTLWIVNISISRCVELSKSLGKFMTNRLFLCHRKCFLKYHRVNSIIKKLCGSGEE